MTLRQVCLACAIPGAVLFAALPARAATSDVFETISAPSGVAVSPLEASAPMHVVLTLPLSDDAGARRFATLVSNPKSAIYGHYITPAQFGERYGADKAAYESLRTWAASYGLTVGERTQSRTTISLAGTAGQFASIFGTQFGKFTTTKHGDGYVTLSEPRLPAALVGKVDGVVGLSSAASFAPMYRYDPAKTLPDVGTGKGGGYAPSDLRTAYDVPTQTNTKATEIVALFEESGFPVSDVTAYEKQYGIPSVTVTPISVNGSGTGTNGALVEVDLDIDAVIGMNPNVGKVLVYIDENGSFSSQLVNAFNKVADDNLATVFSISYGLDENQQGKPAAKAENKALVQLEAEGITTFASSGDDGAGGREGSGLNAPDPGSQPLLTSVGGTTLTTKAKTQAYVGEVTWNSDDGATGGGVSSFWKIPTYQVINGKSVAIANGGSAKKRNVPDIAADADYPNSPYSVYCGADGGFIAVGGTSLSSPLWAGWVSIINSDRVAAGKARIGYLNPVLYPLGSAKTGFHDITKGNNGTPGYTAGPGYDNTTGWGSIDVTKFMAQLP
jgi:subtilase family serine protease